jgi:hypothetical protein
MELTGEADPIKAMGQVEAWSLGVCWNQIYWNQSLLESKSLLESSAGIQSLQNQSLL